MLPRSIAFLILMPIVLVVGVKPIGGSELLEARLSAPVSARTVTARDLPSALAEVAGEFRIPMVIEWVDQPGRNAVEVSVKDGTVYNLVQSVVGTQPGYGVQITDGVVHIFDRRFFRDRQNFLNLKIHNFERERTAASLVGGDLLQLAAQTVSPPPPLPVSPSGAAGIISSQGVSLDEPEVTLKLRTVTLREALETLAREADDEIWVVTFLGPKEVTPTGFRRTITLWNDSPPGDKPVWDFFRWGWKPRRVLDQ